MSRHPNLAAALIIGLGCERHQIAGLMAEQGLAVGPYLKTFTMQETGGTRKTIEAGDRGREGAAARGQPGASARPSPPAI